MFFNMNKVRKSLGQLFASQMTDDEDKKSSDNSENEAKDKKKDDQQTDDDDQEDEDQKDDEKDKKSEDSDDKKASESGQDNEGTVTLALADYDRLVALASTAKTASEENKTLKAKADKWDSYQAALSGNKPDADATGAKSEKADQESKDPNAALRARYGSLMTDV